ncbi:hypothetical protein I8J38_30390, partial [Bacillus sp. OA1]|nr:hypothetical protein [Bacillus sp. OA1]
MFEHDESNLKELEDRPRCCPINYQDSSNMPESEITVLQRNTTIRKRFRIFIGNAGSIQMYLEPEDTPLSKILNLTLYEIELHQDRDLDVPPHLRDAYSVEQNKIEDFEPGEVIEISGCS